MKASDSVFSIAVRNLGETHIFTESDGTNRLSSRARPVAAQQLAASGGTKKRAAGRPSLTGSPEPNTESCPAHSERCDGDRRRDGIRCRRVRRRSTAGPRTGENDQDQQANRQPHVTLHWKQRASVSLMGRPSHFCHEMWLEFPLASFRTRPRCARSIASLASSRARANASPYRKPASNSATPGLAAASASSS